MKNEYLELKSPLTPGSLSSNALFPGSNTFVHIHSSFIFSFSNTSNDSRSVYGASVCILLISVIFIALFFSSQEHQLQKNPL